MFYSKTSSFPFPFPYPFSHLPLPPTPPLSCPLLPSPRPLTHLWSTPTPGLPCQKRGIIFVQLASLPKPVPSIVEDCHFQGRSPSGPWGAGSRCRNALAAPLILRLRGNIIATRGENGGDVSLHGFITPRSTNHYADLLSLVPIRAWGEARL